MVMNGDVCQMKLERR